MEACFFSGVAAGSYFDLVSKEGCFDRLPFPADISQKMKADPIKIYAALKVYKVKRIILSKKSVQLHKKLFVNVACFGVAFDKGFAQLGNA